MKRSEINRIMQSADAFIRKQGFHLPPFAYWSPADWQQKGPEAREIVDNRLGWDITDFGLGDFPKYGLFLFTLRNGNPENWKSRRGKLYAEKIMMVEEGQTTPMHFHWIKMEDIINRGGGDLNIQLYNSTPDEKLNKESQVNLSVDSILRRFKPGEVLTLTPGESVCLPPYCYHKFWAENGRVLVGEVSMVNDDDADNRFLEPIGRFSTIEEDEAPLYLLCNEYERYYSI
jgi:hypothetical protein